MERNTRGVVCGGTVEGRGRQEERERERGRNAGERDSTSSVCTSRLLSLSSITGLILREETSSCRTDVFTGKERETRHLVIYRDMVCVHLE